MGCDIHGPFLETCAIDDDKPRWWCQAKFRFSRNYWLFALMANVRNYDNDKDGVFRGEMCYKPLGYPKDASWETNENYFVYINDEPDGVERSCTRKKAEEWVAHGCSFYKDEDKHYVSDPDAHSATWLTTLELEDVYQRYKTVLEESGEDESERRIKSVEALLAAMKSLESNPTVKCRIVFWFDN